jgi:hypothetical protein
MSIKMFHKDASATSCTVEGVIYEADETGAFEVADEHAAVLLDHGFTTTEPVPAQDNGRKANPAMMSTDALLDEAKELEIPDFADLARGALITAVAAARKAKAGE